VTADLQKGYLVVKEKLINSVSNDAEAQLLQAKKLKKFQDLI